MLNNGKHQVSKEIYLDAKENGWKIIGDRRCTRDKGQFHSCINKGTFQSSSC